MARLYKRTIEVTVGDNDNNAITIRNLYMKLEVKKTTSNIPDEGIITIRNLNPTHETFIRNTGTRIRILAGYEDNLGLIFDGDIRDVDRDPQKPDTDTLITLGSNVFALTDALFNRSYTGQTTVRQIIQDAIPSTTLGFRNINVIPENAVLNDFVFSGRTLDLFQSVLAPLNITCYENNGVLLFSRVGETLPQEAYVLRSGTGLVGSPSVTDDGIKARSLLNADLDVNEPVQVISQNLVSSAQGEDSNNRAAETQGFYKIYQLVHRGDNWDGEFVTEFEARSL